MSVMKITRENFEEKVLNAEGKILVDFWATWCGPCRMLAPVLDDVAAEDESIVIAKIDVDEEPQLAAQYGITTIPTLMVMEKGQVVATTVGVQTKAQILKLMEG